MLDNGDKAKEKVRLMRLLYFSTVNWKWIKQRPHFEAYYLAQEGIQVDYLSLTPLFKQKKEKRQKLGTHLNIKDYYVLPLASKIELINQINRVYINSVLTKVYDVIVLTHPVQYHYLKSTKKHQAKIIYECMDNMPYFYEGKMREKVIQEEEELCKVCDQIIVSADYLKEKIKRLYHIPEEKITVIKNAIDESLITQQLQPITLEHPNLMYIGTVSDWFDIEALEVFLTKHSEYKVYLIGPVIEPIKNRLSKLKDQVVLVGAVPHEWLKTYILQGDIMMIPFKKNDIIEAVDPVKMYEYMAFDKPVVSAYWEELKDYRANQNIYFYQETQGFETSVIEASKSLQEQEKINQAFIKQNHWKQRVKQYIEVLKGDGNE